MHIIILLLWEFFLHQPELIVSHWNVSDSESPHVSRTLLSILTDLNNAAVWMASTCPLLSKSSSPFTNPLGIISSVRTPPDVTISFVFHRVFFQFSSKVYVLNSHFVFFYFQLVVSRDARVHFLASSLFSFLFLFFFFFLLTFTRSGRLAKIKWSVFCVTFFTAESWLCIYHLFVGSNLYFLHNSQWITFPTQSCLDWYSLCANLLHSVIIWLIVSSLSPLHSLIIIDRAVPADENITLKEFEKM